MLSVCDELYKSAKIVAGNLPASKALSEVIVFGRLKILLVAKRDEFVDDSDAIGSGRKNTCVLSSDCCVIASSFVGQEEDDT